ncbi:hypothetical protein LSPH24S_04994 [Lysinibacillus sphaericus]
MNREQLILLVSEKLKLIRTEKALTQDQMSHFSWAFQKNTRANSKRSH